MAPERPQPPLSRREMLRQSGTGFGALALTDLLVSAGMVPETQAIGAPEEDGRARSPLAAKTPHFPARAKHVIHVFLNGGLSQVDSFDHKPALARYSGKMLPVKNLKTERETGAAFPSPYRFRKYGESGIEVSEIFSRLAECVDDMAIVRSMHADVPNHNPSFLLMNTGDGTLVRPSVGSWITYGLGTENQNLPGFVVLSPGGYPTSVKSYNWRSAFLPGAYQGTFVDSEHTNVNELIPYLRNQHLPLSTQRRQLQLVQKLNARHLEQRTQPDHLEARIQSFELAYRMQMEATDAFDVTREPKHILDMYGPGSHARQCLIARRLVERGVRFVQLWHGVRNPWDNHTKLPELHRQRAGEIDQPLAALLTDLKQRGLLDETLVICGGEFGRTPTVELPRPSEPNKMLGRDHNHYGFTVWLAGGGVKGGHIHGATDEFGYQAVEDKVHVHDLHATILHLLGFDHERLTFRYAGRDFRLTDVHGRVVSDLFA